MVGLTTKAIRTFEPSADIGTLAMKVEEREVLHSREHTHYVTEVNGLMESSLRTSLAIQELTQILRLSDGAFSSLQEADHLRFRWMVPWSLWHMQLLSTTHRNFLCLELALKTPKALCIHFHGFFSAGACI